MKAQCPEAAVSQGRQETADPNDNAGGTLQSFWKISGPTALEATLVTHPLMVFLFHLCHSFLLLRITSKRKHLSPYIRLCSEGETIFLKCIT
jgi:hypothetical protein